MRSLVIIFLTLAVLMVGFFLYEYLQPSLAPLNNEPHEEVLATQPSNSANHMGIGPGEGVWIERHNPNNGNLTERFRGTHYDWNPDGTMKVASPQAEFFLDQGRIMRVNGRTGNVVVEEGGPPGKNAGITMTQPAAPTRGNMKDVTIRLFESDSAPKPTLTVTMDNATFDTQINRIYTDASTIDGKNVAGDQIPVHMRGEDEDFDGWGLQIRWDQKQSKLQLLQVDHGQRLLIKHPNATEKSTHPQKAPTPVAPASPASPATPPQIASPAHAPTIQVYRASFQNDVHVVQANAELARADEMQVDFAAEQNGSADSASSPSIAATPRPAEKREGSVPAVDAQSETSNAKGNKQPAKEKNSSKQNGLGDQPILITWTGKLIVTPYSESGPLRADPHGQVITFLGAPMTVRQKGTQITARDLAYGTTQEELLAHGTDTAPVIMNNSDGARVQTQSIDYFRKDQRAVLTGAGSVVRPLKTENHTQSQMTAQWSQSCQLTFFGSDEHDQTIHTADLLGSVKIDHPQVKLTADQLNLAFAPPVAANQQPDLDHLHSVGSVNAVVNDSHGKSQAIQCQTLDLSTAAITPVLGQLAKDRQPTRYINRLLADGQVWRHDPDSEIRAAHLDAILIPAPSSQQGGDQPLAAVQLHHLLATTDVHVRGKNNASADADSLDVTMDAGQASNVILKGNPARTQKGQDITIGNLITLKPKEGLYDIPGAGSMHLSRQDQNNSSPTDVSWQSSLHANLNQNAIDIDRGVIVKTTSTDQARNTATSDHLHITLEDKPASATTKSPMNANSDSLFAGAADTDVAGQKQAKSLTMLGNVHVQSVRADDAGHLLMQFNLESTRLDYAIAQQKMVCPEPGKIFFYDDRKAAPTAATAPAQPNNPMAGQNARGRTAIKYDDNLVYDQSTGRIELHKNVFLRHEPLDAKQSPMELRSQNMFVDLLKSGTQAAPDQMAISHLLATDQVMFTDKTMQCQASSIDYTPATGIFIIRGEPNVPARMFDTVGASTGTFDEMYYNSKTEQIERMTGFHSAVRRGPQVPANSLVPPQQ